MINLRDKKYGNYEDKIREKVRDNDLLIIKSTEHGDKQNLGLGMIASPSRYDFPEKDKDLMYSELDDMVVDTFEDLSEMNSFEVEDKKVHYDDDTGHLNYARLDLRVEDGLNCDSPVNEFSVFYKKSLN